jgi:hypothetical protein
MSMTKQLFALLLIGLTTASLAGCGSSDDAGAAASGGSDMDDLAAMLDKPTPPAGESPAAADLPPGEFPSEGSPQGISADAPEQAPAAPNDERAVAGRAPMDPGGGYYSAIAGARRHIVNRVESLAWTQAVQHFQATEGRLPKDHDEFMSRIVAPLDIDLGYKEEDQEFLYDPSEGQWGTLYVVSKEQPAGEQQSGRGAER